jgi:protein-disulfide isomerase/uncharacterized membrane protein
MFTNYLNPTQSIHGLLSKLNINSTLLGIDKQLQIHPNYPSLLSIMDTLSDYKVDNAAYKISIDEITKIPTPFVSFVKIDGGNFIVVDSVKNNTISYTLNNQNISTSIEEFKSNWNEVVLIASVTEESVEPNYKKNIKIEKWQNLKIPIFLGLGILLVIVAAFFQKTIYSETSLLFYVFSFIYFAGVFVTSLLLWYEVDKANPTLQKICTGAKKVNCSAILNSKQSKMFGILSWSEIGFFYFSIGYLFLLLQGNNALTLVIFLNIIALPYTIFSIYYQWRVIKQWCILCLWVQVILAAQFLSTVLLYPNGLQNLINIEAIGDIPSNTYSAFIIISVISPLLWYFMKPLLIDRQKSKRTIQELNRMKYNADVYYGLLYKQKNIGDSANDLGITIGNPKASNTIVKVCNPYCGPCAKAHPRLENLLHQIPNLKIKIIFAAPSSIKENYNNPINHLMAIAAKNDEQLTKKALDDWYLAKKKYYPAFAEKYKMNEELERETNKIVLMHKWCTETNITFTPTIFFNGYQLPEAYNIEDLRHFIEEEKSC